MQNDAAPRHNVALGCSDQYNVGLGLPVLRRRRLGLTLPCDERVPSVRRNSQRLESSSDCCGTATLYEVLQAEPQNFSSKPPVKAKLV